MGFLNSYTNVYNRFLENLASNRKLAEIDRNTLQKMNSSFDVFYNNLVRENENETVAAWTDLLNQASVDIDDSDRNLSYAELRAIYITGNAPVVPILGTVNVTDAPSVTLNAAQGNLFKWPLGGNRTLAGISNLVDGQSFIIEFTQDPTGGRTITFPSTWKTPGGKAANAILSTAANVTDILTGYYDGTTVTFVLNLENQE